MITIQNCNEGELHEAMREYLVRGKERTQTVFEVCGQVWGPTREETKEAWAERFPRGMDQRSNKKGRKV